jgi:hypothetical protein
MAGDMFTHLFENMETPVTLNPMSEDSRDWEQKGVLRKFSQKEFLPDDLKWNEFSGLDDFGYVYYPNTCIGESGCKVHLFLHGCASGFENIFDWVIRYSGWTQYAAENNLIVLFPQVKSNYQYNQGGCW